MNWKALKRFWHGKRAYTKIKTSEILTVSKMRESGMKKTEIANELKMPYWKVNYIDTRY